jgi:hypothetical protein
MVEAVVAVSKRVRHDAPFNADVDFKLQTSSFKFDRAPGMETVYTR